MIPRRVFSPSIKLLTSENRLKGNSQLDCESQTLPSNTGTIKKQTLPSTDLITISTVSSVNVENNKNTSSCINIDKNDTNNQIENDVSYKKVIDADIDEENGSKSNKLENNLIGTQEIVAQHQGNYQSNSSSSSSSSSCISSNSYITNNDDDANELSKKIELNAKRRDVETTINNVPLRDVIQRKVSKLPHQLLHGSKELSTKLATAATTTTKNVSKTKRLLFRRKTTTITKDQIEAAKVLQNINNSSSILLTLNNEPITVSLAQQQPKSKQKLHQEKSQVNQSHGGEYNNNNNNRQANVNAHQTENEQQQYYRQSSISTKQKPATNSVTIVTASFDKRKNERIENKYKLNEANRNKNRPVPLHSSAVTIGNAEANSNENYDIVEGETVSISKRYYSKQSLAANNNLKSNNFALQIRASVPVTAASEPLNGKALNIFQGKKPARPPSYVNPPSPTASNTNVMSNIFLTCKQTLNNFPNDCSAKNNRIINNGTNNITDEYENYAVPYVETPTTPLDELNTNSSIHIRIANQFQSQSKVNPAQKSYLKNQNNSPFLSQSRSQNRDNREPTNETLIANECMLFDAFGQSTSSDSSDSNDALKLNERNDNKMDPHTITNLTSPCDMLTKPEFSSSHLQNIPVRPRKGVPHLENYCLFDPSKDFVNEKELKKKYGLVSGDCMPYPIKILDKRTNEDELIKETIYEDHDYVYDTLEDVKEEDEDENDEMVESFPNYFTIDPDYIEQNKMETLFSNANHLQPIVESETEDIYSDTNANLNKTFHLYENQESAPLKKSPQMEKIVRQSSQPIITTNAAKKLMSSSLNSKCFYTSKNEPILVKGQNGKVTLKNRTKLSPPTDLPLRNSNQSAVKVAASKKRNSFTLKHSISTPQLSLKDLLADNAALPMVEIEAKNNVSSVGAANRLSQCKMRRPASQHSDADSGFLSPVTPPSNDAFNQSNSTYPQCDTTQGYIELYTNWTNHYLDKVKSKRRVNDLAVDCRDGLLLADVVEGVTSVKVPDLIRKPKTQQQMFENVNNCLNTLHTLAVGGLDGITTNDICSGRLRAILDLFYALSVHKQAAKQKTGVSIGNKQQAQQATAQTQPIPQSTSQQNQLGHQPATVNASNEMLNRQLPAPYGKPGLNGTSIPVPATVLVARRCPPDKVRPLPPTPGQTQIGARTNGNCETTQQNGNPPTHIPKTNSGLRQQNACKMLASPYSMQNHIAGNGSIVAPNGPPPPPTKHSMLDKLKLFNKEKSDRSSKTQISKRTSSSSGFSSARSERSDSSVSLNNDQTPNTKTTGIPIQSNLKKPEITTKTKSKVMTSSTKSGNKDTLTKKSDKKDKSPARMSADMSDSKIAVPKTPKTSAKIESKLKPVSSAKQQKSMEQNRSDSKTNLSSQVPPSKTNAPITAQTTNAQNPVSTGIPKPMAAIKGTTKPPPSNIHNNQTNGQKSSDAFNENNIKHDKLSDISNQNNNISTTNQDSGKMQIIAPILIENAANQQMLANHLHMQQALNQQNISMNDSCHSKSTHSSSTGTASNSSESGLIYRPQSESSASDSISMRTNNATMSPTNKMILMNQRHKNDRFGMHDSTNVSMMKAPSNGSIASSASSSVTGMPGLSNSNANKFNTVPSKPIQNANGIIYEEEKQMTILPMRPLLRGYSSHLTLPTRGNRNQQIAHEYSDDIGQGYCSDGDALRKIPVRYSDIENGYMSEGGGVSSTNGNTLQHKPMLLRARTQLPTTIEERCRSSRGEHMDSVGLQTHVMDLNAGNRHRSPLPPPANGAHLLNGNGNIEQWPKLADQSNGRESSLSPTPHRKDKGSPSHSRRNSSSKNPQSRAKSAPQNFSYIKRPNGAMDPNQQIYGTNGGRTAHVSAVPRSNKIKVSGGTQTCTADLQSKIPPNTQHRSFSLTGPSAAQLSQSIRERLANGTHSLPKPGTDLSVFQHRMANRGSLKMIDGSLSDTQTYAEVKTDYSSYAMWLKHSNTTHSRLSEGDTVDITGMGTPATTRTHKMMQRESSYTQSPRLNRSNSIRSTKSEKMYPSIFTRGQDIEVEPYYCLPVGTMAAHQNAGLVGKTAVPWSQPTSPTPPSRFSNGPLSPTHATYRLTYPKKNDDAHGSTASLISGGSSLYGSAEERQANEVRRLKRELGDARDQVNSLSTQLTLHMS